MTTVSGELEFVRTEVGAYRAAYAILGDATAPEYHGLIDTLEQGYEEMCVEALLLARQVDEAGTTHLHLVKGWNDAN